MFGIILSEQYMNQEQLLVCPWVRKKLRVMLLYVLNISFFVVCYLMWILKKHKVFKYKIHLITILIISKKNNITYLCLRRCKKMKQEVCDETELYDGISSKRTSVENAVTVS